MSSESAVMIKVVKSHKSRLSSAPSLFQIMREKCVSSRYIALSDTPYDCQHNPAGQCNIFIVELAQYAYPVQTECLFY